MSNLVFRLPRYYQDSPQVSELERVLGEQAGALRVSESDTLAQLWVDTATWGLDLWEQWVGLPVDRTRPYSYRRSRIKAKLRGQGATTAEMLRSVVASFGFEPSQISVIEHPAEYQFEIVLVRPGPPCRRMWAGLRPLSTRLSLRTWITGSPTNWPSSWPPCG